MAVDFGTDLNCLTDLDPLLGLVDRTTNLGQALAHRLETPRGGLFYDANYGTDLRAYANEAMYSKSVAACASDAQSECLKDERVLSCTATVQFVPQTSSLTVTLNVATAAGPFTFVLAVTSVSVSLLEPQVTAQ